MMNPLLNRKPLVTALVEIISTAITHNELDDAEVILAAVRALRPTLRELDTFEAWVAIKRGHWQDAIRVLRNLDASTDNWSLGKALMAFCEFALGDPSWSISANEVLESDCSTEAAGLVRLLMGHDETHLQTQATESSVPLQSSLDAHSMQHASYLRA